MMILFQDQLNIERKRELILTYSICYPQVKTKKMRLIFCLLVVGSVDMFKTYLSNGSGITFHPCV